MNMAIRPSRRLVTRTAARLVEGTLVWHGRPVPKPDWDDFIWFDREDFSPIRFSHGQGPLHDFYSHYRMSVTFHYRNQQVLTMALWGSKPGMVKADRDIGISWTFDQLWYLSRLGYGPGQSLTILTNEHVLDLPTLLAERPAPPVGLPAHPDL